MALNPVYCKSRAPDSRALKSAVRVHAIAAATTLLGFPTSSPLWFAFLTFRRRRQLWRALCYRTGH